MSSALRHSRLSTRFRYAGGISDYARAGILLGFGSEHADYWQRAATYVDKVLNGTKPSELPVELPTKFSLIINGKTAKALGLTIPQKL